MTARSASPVIVRTRLGLGNQLFQYAAASSLARRIDAPVHCHASRSGHRLLQVCLGEQWTAASTAELWRCGMALEPWALAVASRLRRVASRAGRGILGRPPRRFEPAGHSAYEPIFERLTAPCYLYGYFQHSAYWSDEIDSLSATVGRELGLRRSMSDRPIIAVHVRRNDYLTMGWALGPAYYRHAIEQIAGALDRPIVRVLGDDPRFVDAFEDQLDRDGHLVERDPGPIRHPEPALADLIRLAESDHMVLSNSTYAWWGAALGDHLHRDRPRLVAMPDRWLEDEPSDVLRRPGWSTVPTGVATSARPAPTATPVGTHFDAWWLDADR